MRLLASCAFLALCACGPREIGEGAAEPVASKPEVLAVDTMRYPMTGMDNTQKMLYWQNRPDVMQNVQAWRREQYRRQMGLAPDPEDPAYRETPKMRSPFRQ